MSKFFNRRTRDNVRMAFHALFSSLRRAAKALLLNPYVLFGSQAIAITSSVITISGARHLLVHEHKAENQICIAATDEGHRMAGIPVALREPLTGKLIACGKTDALGQCTFNDVRSGDVLCKFRIAGRWFSYSMTVPKKGNAHWHFNFKVQNGVFVLVSVGPNARGARHSLGDKTNRPKTNDRLLAHRDFPVAASPALCQPPGEHAATSRFNSLPDTVPGKLDTLTEKGIRPNRLSVAHNSDTSLLKPIRQLNEAPIVYVDTGAGVHHNYKSGLGGVLFWTPCPTCGYTISIGPNDDRFLDKIIVNPSMPTLPPQGAVFDSLVGGHCYYILIKDKNGLQYRYYDFKAIPGKTLLIEIRKP